MKHIISKIQRRSFEEGEFVEAQERAFHEVIMLIECFPWFEQKDSIKHIRMPSIVLNDGQQNSLSLTLDFNENFGLLYCLGNKELFSKRIMDIKDAYPYIQAFFRNEDFDLRNFEMENKRTKRRLMHFDSKTFRYEITPKSVRAFFFKSCWFSLLLGSIMIFTAVFSDFFKMDEVVTFLFFLLYFFIGGGLNLLLFLNYYRLAKGKILIMSRGDDVFYYGGKNQPMKYIKTQKPNSTQKKFIQHKFKVKVKRV